MNRQVAALRAQRAEVEAWLDWRAASQREAAEEMVVAWWRLALARRQRMAVTEPAEAACLTPLPDPPRGALGRMQALRLRFGLMQRDRVVPPRSVAERLGGQA